MLSYCKTGDPRDSWGWGFTVEPRWLRAHVAVALAGFLHQDLSTPRGSLFSSSCSSEFWKTEGSDTRVMDIPPPAASFQGEHCSALGPHQTFAHDAVSYRGWVGLKHAVSQEPSLMLLPYVEAEGGWGVLVRAAYAGPLHA